MKFGWIALAAAGLACSVTSASAADNIACMDAPYAAADQRVFDQFNESFELDEFSGKGPPVEVITILSTRAGECAETLDWSPEAIEHATLYRLGKVLDDALVASSVFSPAQWTRLKAAYATSDKAILNRLFRPMIEAELGGDAASKPTRADELYLGRLMLRTGIPATEANSQFVGAWMAAQAMQELFLSGFAEL